MPPPSVTPWLSRTFTFELSPGDAPALLSRLRGTPARAGDLAAGASDAMLGTRPEATQWSAKEHIAHLHDLAALDDRRLEEYLAGATALSPADMTNAATESGAHNTRPMAAILETLAAGRAAWVAALERLDATAFTRRARHPRLQRELQLVDWLSFVAAHDDHHLARAHEALHLARQRAAEPGPSARDSIRARFAIPDGVTYLNCASSGPYLHSTTAAGQRAVAVRATPWTLSPADWFTGIETVRGLAARVLGVDADGVAIVPSASYGIATAARQARVGRGQTIVLMDQEFPSNVYAWRRLAAGTGGSIVAATRAADESWTEAVLRHVDARTAVVSVPQCHWTDGSVVDLVSIGAAARAVGALFVVDASQALGAYPLDLARSQPDFVVSVGYKWLFGPYGLAYLYAAPRWREEGVPIEETWLARVGAEDFTALVDYRDTYRPGARRFDMGGLAQFIHGPMAVDALTQILAWGPATIQAHTAALTAHAAVRAARAGFEACAPEARVGHIVGLRAPRGLPGDLRGRLAAARIVVSFRGDAVRVAPHLFNDIADVDRLLDLLTA